MRKLITMLLVACMCMLSVGCANSRMVDGNQVEPYGVFNQKKEVESVRYKVSVGNVVWSVLLCETVIAPVVLIGFFLFEPVGPKAD